MEACRAELTYASQQISNPNFYFYRAEQAAILLGFYGLERLSSHQMELMALFIDPPFIRQGHGQMLFQHVQATVTTHEAQTLIIQIDPNAQAFYSDDERTGGGSANIRQYSRANAPCAIAESAVYPSGSSINVEENGRVISGCK